MWEGAVLGGGAAGSHAKAHWRKAHQVSLLPMDGLELIGAQQAQNCHAQIGEGAGEDEEATLPCGTHSWPVRSRAVRRRSVIENGVQSKKSGEKLQSDSEKNQELWRGEGVSMENLVPVFMFLFNYIAIVWPLVMKYLKLFKPILAILTIPAGRQHHPWCQWAASPMGNMDFRDRLAGALHELHLVLISIEDWLLIQRESFDIHIDEEPYHALQIYANLAKRKYVIRVWGTSVKSGEFSTMEELTSLCASNFGRTVSCLGYLGADPGGMALVQVRHPCPRWISKTCAVTFDKNQSGLIVGLCSACSGERANGKNHFAEEVPLRRKSSASHESARSNSGRLMQNQNQKSANHSEDSYPDDPMDSLDWPEKRKVEDSRQRGEPRQVS